MKTLIELLGLFTFYVIVGTIGGGLLWWAYIGLTWAVSR